MTIMTWRFPSCLLILVMAGTAAAQSRVAAPSKKKDVYSLSASLYARTGDPIFLRLATDPYFATQVAYNPALMARIAAHGQPRRAAPVAAPVAVSAWSVPAWPPRAATPRHQPDWAGLSPLRDVDVIFQQAKAQAARQFQQEMANWQRMTPQERARVENDLRQREFYWRARGPWFIESTRAIMDLAHPSKN